MSRTMKYRRQRKDEMRTINKIRLVMLFLVLVAFILVWAGAGLMTAFGVALFSILAGIKITE